MRTPHTRFMNTAARGALVGGASSVGSGMAPGRVLVDANRPAVFAPEPAHAAGGSIGLQLQSIAPN